MEYHISWTYEKISENLIWPTPSYAHTDTHVRISEIRNHSKNFRKFNISYPLIHTYRYTCAYQWDKKSYFFGKFFICVRWMMSSDAMNWWSGVSDIDFRTQCVKKRSRLGQRVVSLMTFWKIIGFQILLPFHSFNQCRKIISYLRSYS